MYNLATYYLLNIKPCACFLTPFSILETSDNLPPTCKVQLDLTFGCLILSSLPQLRFYSFLSAIKVWPSLPLESQPSHQIGCIQPSLVRLTISHVTNRTNICAKSKIYINIQKILRFYLQHMLVNCYARRPVELQLMRQLKWSCNLRLAPALSPERHRRKLCTSHHHNRQNVTQ